MILRNPESGGGGKAISSRRREKGGKDFLGTNTRSCARTHKRPKMKTASFHSSSPHGVTCGRNGGGGDPRHQDVLRPRQHSKEKQARIHGAKSQQVQVTAPVSLNSHTHYTTLLIMTPHCGGDSTVVVLCICTVWFFSCQDGTSLFFILKSCSIPRTSKKQENNVHTLCSGS